MTSGNHSMIASRLRKRRWALALLAPILIAACQTVHPDFDESRDLWNQGRFEEAVVRLREALDRNPNDHPLKAVYEHQRELALAQLTMAAGHLRDAHQYAEARTLLQSALRLDPQYNRALDEMRQLETAERLDQLFDQARARFEAGDLSGAEMPLREILAQNPTYGAARRLLAQVRERQTEGELEPKSLKTALTTPITLDLRDTPMRNVFDALSQTAGLNFVFDKDVHTDTKITIFIRNSLIDDVLRLILTTNGLARRILNENTVLIYPNNAGKAREYQSLVVRTFYLVNADAKQVQSLLKSMAHVKEVYLDEKLNLVTIRDTPDAVRLAERLVESVDVAESEVMLEVEVMEIGRTRAEQLGLQFPTQLTRSAANTAQLMIPTSQLGQTITSITNPVLIANLFLQDQDANLLANPRIRVKNHEKAKVVIGEKLPLITSTAVPSVGQSTAVSYVDVGLKLEVEPQIYLNDEVGIKVNLEVNSNLGAVTQLGTTAYDVGTRSATTVLRLHDGETQVLAGLINDNDQGTISRVPGMSDIPGIGRLFANNNTTHEKSEVVLLITPRIIRNVVTPDFDTLLLQAGTDAEVGSRTLAIGPTAPHSVNLTAQPGAVKAVPEAPEIRERRENPEPPLVPAIPVPGKERDSQGRLGSPAPATAWSTVSSNPGGGNVVPPSAPEIGMPPTGGPAVADTPSSNSIAAPAPAPGAIPIVALNAPDQVDSGGKLSLSIQVAGTGSAVGGEVTVSFDPRALRTMDSASGVLTVPLDANGSGSLTGRTALGIAHGALGVTDIRATSGVALMPDGSRRDLDTSSAVVTVTIGS
jgi:general secretion pathway protein D